MEDKKRIYVRFLSDFDPEEGYAVRIINIPKDQIENIKGKTIITLYGTFEEGE